ncbi:hypothetical protein T484DRAFT_1750065 [Baffinella frigidus]|nr:hypothetical protein T484DRAFT_1750065 [Cryptophyta sp. CCMP2293]
MRRRARNLSLELRDGEPELLRVLPAREVSEVCQESEQHLRDTPRFSNFASRRGMSPSVVQIVCNTQAIPLQMNRFRWRRQGQKSTFPVFLAAGTTCPVETLTTSTPCSASVSTPARNPRRPAPAERRAACCGFTETEAGRAASEDLAAAAWGGPRMESEGANADAEVARIARATLRTSITKEFALG